MGKPRYARVQVSIWNDKKFQGMSLYARYVFLFLLTSQLQTMLGLLPAKLPALASAIELPIKRFTAAFEELIKLGIVEYDEKGLVWVKNYLRHNPPANSNVVSSWGSLISLYPECPLRDKALEVALKHCAERKEESFLKKCFESFSSVPFVSAYGLPNHLANQKQNQKQNQNQYQKKQTEAEEVTDAQVAFPYLELPESWRNACQRTRPDVSPDDLFYRMKQYFTVGKGCQELCTLTEWFSRWSSWLQKERATSFGKEMTVIDYTKGINEDGSF